YGLIASYGTSVRPDSVVWDIGSCSGSVAIEAARLASFGRVYAVEKSAGRVKDIKANIRRFGVDNVEVLYGIAPDCLRKKDIALPDVVFVGGGGSKVGEILAFLARRIKPGARVVATAVTLETASAVTAFFNKALWQVETTLVSLAKTRNIGELNLLGAYNPVFVLSASKPC
ncbi:MAG: precorrin-6Y C5,15-methyltransferase (decarboxylating) subunit CbiT, partial [Deltaproteobacteria bacterium RIFCSPLOWO2_02_FULL_53_8]